MTKLNSNSKISHANIYGRIIQHELYLDQSVLTTSSPTFASLSVTGDTIINGNLQVHGNSVILGTESVQLQDNIIILNDLETGPGVTLNESGIEIERGSLENQRLVYQESTNAFLIGPISQLQKICTREDSPLENGIMVWNDTLHRADSKNQVDIDIRFKSTTETTNETTGSIIVDGGVSVLKDIRIKEKLYIGSNNIHSTGGNLVITVPTNGNIIIPTSTKLQLGDTSINSDTNGNIVMTTVTNGSVLLNTKLAFSDTDYIKKETNSLVLHSSKDISLTTGSGGSVYIPEESAIMLGNGDEYIVGNQNGDVSIVASNNINLLATNDVRVSDTGIKLGGSGNQRIMSNTFNELILMSSGDMLLEPQSTIVKLPSVSFTNTPNTISANSDHLISSRLLINDTTDAVGTVGSLMTKGGIVSLKNIKSEAQVIAQSIDINSGGITSTQGALITTDCRIQLNTSTDTTHSTTGYSFMRSNNRSLDLNLPSYTAGNNSAFNIQSENVQLLSIKSNGFVTLSSTELAVDSSTGSLKTLGGINTNGLYSSGDIISKTNSTSAVSIKTLSDESILQVNTLDKITTIGSKVIVTDTTDASNSSTASLILSGGAVIQKKLIVNDTLYANNTIYTSSVTGLITPVNPSDATSKAYVDLLIQGITVSGPVRVATITTGNLSTDFFQGAVIDGYTLELNDRILLKDQASSLENGIYNVKGVATPPERTLDFDIGSEISGKFVFVQEGSINKSLGFVCNSPSQFDVVGTHSLFFVQFTALGHIEAGSALSKNFNQLNVNVDDSSIEVFADALRIKNTISGTGLTGGSGSVLQTTTDQSHVTKVGTLTTGTWQANTIQTFYGGTGRSRFTSGTVLIGNELGGLASSSKLFFNTTLGNLGIGTNNPTSQIHVASSISASLLIEADTDEVSSLAYPSIKLKRGGNIQANIALERSAGTLLTGSVADSLLIYNTDSIQFGVDGFCKMFIGTNGNIGINSTTPSTALYVDGTLSATGIVNLTNTNGSLIVHGSASILKSLDVNQNLNTYSTYTSYSTENATNSSSASIIVKGGMAIEKDLILQGIATIGSVHLTSTAQNCLTTIGGIQVAKNADIDGDIILAGNIQLATTSNLYITEGSLVISTNNKDLVQFGNYINILDTTASISSSTASLTLAGGINIKCTMDSNSTAGGSLYAAGGILVDKTAILNSAIIQTNLNVLNDLIVSSSGNVRSNYNKLSTAIQNQHTSSNLWVYLGQVTNAIIESDSSRLYIDNQVYHHSLVNSNSTGNLDLVVYQGLSSDYHLFAKQLPLKTSNLQVLSSDTLLSNYPEGNGLLPNGSSSTFTTGWTLMYTTDSIATVQQELGDLIINNSLKTIDHLPIIGHSRQVSKNIGLVHELATDEILFSSTDTLPNQLSANSYQIKFSTSANSADDYYVGWSLKVTSGLNINQVRKITTYNGAQRVASIDLPWTGGQNPIENDTVEFSNRNNTSIYYNSTSGTFSTSFVYTDSSSSLVDTGYTGFKTGNITASNLFVDSTGGNSIFTNGGINVSKNAIADNIGIGTTSPIGNLHITKDNVSVVLEHTTGSTIDFLTSGNSDKFTISGGTDLQLQYKVGSNATTGLTLTTQGYLGVRTSQNINSILTLKKNNYISVDSSDGYLGISGTNSGASTGSSIIIYGNSHATSSNTIILNSSSTTLKNLHGNTLVNINVLGVLDLKNTSSSTSCTVGSILAIGGIGLNCTSNATSFTSGGSITSRGGGAFEKDLYVGGSIFATNLILDGVNSVPVLSFSNTSNCTVDNYGNNQLALIGTEKMLSFYVETTPIVSSDYCQFEFDVPNAVGNFTHASDVIIACSGYESGTLVPLFNVLGVGVTGTTKALIKFQARSIGTHVLQIIARYS